MAIANAIQRGSMVFVYDEKNHLMFTRCAATGPGEGLMGYTGGTINLRKGRLNFTYDEKGQLVGTRSV